MVSTGPADESTGESRYEVEKVPLGQVTDSGGNKHNVDLLLVNETGKVARNRTAYSNNFATAFGEGASRN